MPLVKDQIADLLPKTDVVVCDVGELVAWIHVQQEEAHVQQEEAHGQQQEANIEQKELKRRDDIDINARCLLKELRPGGIVVVTDGANGCVVASMGATANTEESFVRWYPVPQEWRIKAGQVCDTTGAGDAFAAGFLGTLTACAVNGTRFDESEAVRLGQYCAYEILKQQGVQVPNFGPKTRMNWPTDNTFAAA